MGLHARGFCLKEKESDMIPTVAFIIFVARNVLYLDNTTRLVPSDLLFAHALTLISNLCLRGSEWDVGGIRPLKDDSKVLRAATEDPVFR